VQVAEQFEGGHPVEAGPAAQEDEAGAERQVDTEAVAVPGQLRPRAGIDLVVGGAGQGARAGGRPA
jgi:hypothetical protein